MRQRGDGLRLALEARERVGARAQLRGQDLDGDVAIELGVAGAIDLAHSACPERRENLVGAETHPGGQGHAPHYTGARVELVGEWSSFVVFLALRRGADVPVALPTCCRLGCFPGDAGWGNGGL